MAAKHVEERGPAIQCTEGARRGAGSSRSPGWVRAGKAQVTSPNQTRFPQPRGQCPASTLLGDRAGPALPGAEHR